MPRCCSTGLDIHEELHSRKMGELQGGQKVRVLLAQALFGKPEALMLDEPTNYLDLESIHWLQDFLQNYDGTLITISHDRHFLNSVTTHTADIDYETIITYTGGYDDMVMQKTQIRSTLESQNAQREKKIAQLNEFIARFAAGTRSSTGDKPPQGSGAAADQRTGAVEHCSARSSSSTRCGRAASTCWSSRESRSSTTITRSSTASPPICCAARRSA